MKRISINLLCCWLLCISCRHSNVNHANTTAINLPAPDLSNGYTYVSIIGLIGQPSRYNTMKVRIKGYLCIDDSDHRALYLNEEDWENSVTKNAIWLELSKDQLHFGKFPATKTFVLIDGIYNSNNNGPLGSYSGALEHISTVHDVHAD